MSKKKIVFQGEPGANSHLAISQAYPDAEAVPCATFEDAFTALSARDADLGEQHLGLRRARLVDDQHALWRGRRTPRVGRRSGRTRGWSQ